MHVTAHYRLGHHGRRHRSAVSAGSTCFSITASGNVRWSLRPFCWSFAGVCLTQLNTRHEAGLLAGVLALVALGLPAVYFWNCAHGIKIFIRKLGLDKAAKPFYRLQLDETGLSIWMAGEQDKAAPSRQCDWHHIHLAYRTENAIYLYVHQTQAYLWNDSLDAGWEALKTHLPADRLRDLR